MPLTLERHRRNDLAGFIADQLPKLRTQKEVGRLLGITSQAVSQAERSALAKVRDKLIQVSHATNQSLPYATKL